jgi:Ca2+-transporting ATPase
VTRNPYVWGAVLVCLGLIAAACYLPPLADVLKLTSPDARAWVVVFATSLAAMVLGRMATVLIGRWFADSNPGCVPNGPA